MQISAYTEKNTYTEKTNCIVYVHIVHELSWHKLHKFVPNLMIH